MDATPPLMRGKTGSDTLILLGSTGSPYARMARIALFEKNFRHEWVEVASPTRRRERGKWTTSWTPNEKWNIETLNPLGKIPVLLHKGRAWYDSRVICMYIDSLSCTPSLYSAGGETRGNPERAVSILLIEALCHGICDAIALAKGAYLRSAPSSAMSVEASTQALILAALRKLHELHTPASQYRDLALTTMADIALCTALDYIDFRVPAIQWREQFPMLTARHADLTCRQSFAATRLHTHST